MFMAIRFRLRMRLKTGFAGGFLKNQTFCVKGPILIRKDI